MTFVKVKITDIQWDTDFPKELENLPKSLNMEINTEEFEDDEDLELFLSDYLSDEYGFCHKGFLFKVVKKF